MKYSVEREEEAFVTVDGRKLYTLQDLVIWLLTCSEDSFKYHVNDKENHLALWIKNSLGLEELAKEIEGIVDRNKIIEIIKRYLEEEELIKEI